MWTITTMGTGRACAIAGTVVLSTPSGYGLGHTRTPTAGTTKAPDWRTVSRSQLIGGHLPPPVGDAALDKERVPAIDGGLRVVAAVESAVNCSSSLDQKLLPIGRARSTAGP